MPQITNATKAAIIVFVNLLLLTLQAFNVPLTDQQSALVGGLINAAMGVYVAATYKESPKRLPEGLTKDDVEVVIPKD